MAVEVDITPIGSGFNRTLINTNFQRIDTALQDALSRSGGSPNTMSADIDMNSNHLLNVGNIAVESITIDGTEFLADEITAKGDPGTAATITVGTVTTGAAGTSVIVTNVGDETEAIFDITIPRGDTGASGAGSGDMVAAQNLNDVTSKPTAFANIKQAATESATGVVELATTTEAATGTDTTRVVTPAGLTAFLVANPSALDVQVFTSSGTWTKPSSGTLAHVFAWGGGASGARGASSPRAGGGGGGGAYVERVMLLSSLAATVAVTVGAGGTAVASPNFPGIAGGNTTFGSHLTAYGGGGASSSPSSDDGGGGGGGGGIRGAGASTASSTVGGVGGADIYGVTAAAGVDGVDMGGGGGGNKAGSGGDGSLWGGGGGAGGDTIGITNGVGGNATYGGAGGGGGNDDDTAGAGGTSLFGGNGGAGASGGGNGVAGSVPGGGGGGCATGTSGAGGRGQLWVVIT